MGRDHQTSPSMMITGSSFCFIASVLSSAARTRVRRSSLLNPSLTHTFLFDHLVEKTLLRGHARPLRVALVVLDGHPGRPASRSSAVRPGAETPCCSHVSLTSSSCTCRSTTSLQYPPNDWTWSLMPRSTMYCLGVPYSLCFAIVLAFIARITSRRSRCRLRTAPQIGSAASPCAPPPTRTIAVADTCQDGA